MRFKKLFIIWISFFGLMGLICIGPYLLQIFFNTDWFVTEGMINDAYVGESVDDRGTFYFPVVKYRYEVDGEYYRSDRYYAVERKPTRDRVQVEEIIKKYPKGLTTLVWYKLDNHEISALELNNPLRRQVRNGAVMLFYLTPFAYLGYRRIKKRKEERLYSSL